MQFAIVPPYLLRRLSLIRTDTPTTVKKAARNTLLHDRSKFRELREGEPAPPTTAPGRPGMRPPTSVIPKGPNRTVDDAGGAEKTPGTIVREEGEGPTDDVAVNEAYDGLGATYTFYAEVFQRDSIDGAGLPLNATVHYGKDYDNAFWDGSRMVFGDGDGEVFGRFTASVSVIGHELTHGVTQYTAGLEYQNQPGALNESVSDVFGALVEQYSKKQTVTEASWLIGEGLFTPAVHGKALRSMIEPGTAYDDDVLGKDPQPAHMDDYVNTRADNGGVHYNSGIPNRAFAVAAIELGGYAWEHVGLVWYDTLTGGTLSAKSRFAGFASATVRAAVKRFGAGSDQELAVRKGWETVGITPAESAGSGASTKSSTKKSAKKKK